MLTLVTVGVVGRSDRQVPTAPSPSTSAIGPYTVLPPSGPFTSANDELAFSIDLQCAGADISGVVVTREDGQTTFLGVLLPCSPVMAEYHGAGADLFAVVRDFGRGHTVSVSVVVGTDADSLKAGQPLAPRPRSFHHDQPLQRG
jgi:hypothetical protein